MVQSTSVQTACRTSARLVRLRVRSTAAKATSRAERILASASKAIPLRVVANRDTIPLLLVPGDAIRESLQFVRIDDLVIHHADEQLLYRTTAKSIDHLLDRPHGNVHRCFGF